MRAFPCLSAVYGAWANRLRCAGVELLLQREVTLVKRTKDGITVQWQLIDHVDGEGVSCGIGGAGEADFDEIVFCCDADTCLKLLGKNATWMEKKVLGNSRLERHFSTRQFAYRQSLVPVGCFHYLLRQRLYGKGKPNNCYSAVHPSLKDSSSSTVKSSTAPI